MAAAGGSVIWGGATADPHGKKDRGLIQDGGCWWECDLGWKTADPHGKKDRGRSETEKKRLVGKK